MRKTLRLAVLMLALGCPALAGNIPNPPGSPTLPPNVVTEIMLSLLQSVLSLF